MKKCEVMVEKASLVVGLGSVVFVDDRQYEIAKRFLKPIVEEEKTEEPKEEVKKTTRTRSKKK